MTGNFFNIIPRPRFLETGPGVFALKPDTRILLDLNQSEVAAIGKYLAAEFGLAVSAAAGDHQCPGILLKLSPTVTEPEGYHLTATPEAIVIAAGRPEGLFHGVQTLRQLLSFTHDRQIPACHIRDYPRFSWRGAMLDVARFFFRPDEVRRYLDWLALYKINRLHLHLSDDQGWRLMIESWPRLATHGGNTRVGGGPGGYYTQAEYREIVAYAQSRYITVIPEIDMPGHTHAALASHAELNDSGAAPELYTGREVGFSTLCLHKELTYRFIEVPARDRVNRWARDLFRAPRDDGATARPV